MRCGELAPLSGATVVGDSMAPTLNDGDMVIVDGADTAITQAPRVYSIRPDGLEPKFARVSTLPGDRLLVASDNPRYSSIEVSADEIEILGRVISRSGRV